MEEKTIQVGNSVYPLITTGRNQAKQVIRLTRWLKKYGMKAFESLQGRTGEDGLTAVGGMEVLLEFLDTLSDDALLEVFIMATGCTPEEAEEHFDIAQLIDVLVEIYNEQPSVRRLIERFFSVPDSTETSEESSTKSE